MIPLKGKFTMKTFETIKPLRLKNKVSLRGLAKGIGTSAPHLYDVENGNRQLTFDMLIKIYNYLKVDDDTFADARYMLCKDRRELPLEIVDRVLADEDLFWGLLLGGSE